MSIASLSNVDESWRSWKRDRLRPATPAVSSVTVTVDREFLLEKRGQSPEKNNQTPLDRMRWPISHISWLSQASISGLLHIVQTEWSGTNSPSHQCKKVRKNLLVFNCLFGNHRVNNAWMMNRSGAWELNWCDKLLQPAEHRLWLFCLDIVKLISNVKKKPLCQSFSQQLATYAPIYQALSSSTTAKNPLLPSLLVVAKFSAGDISRNGLSRLTPNFSELPFSCVAPHPDWMYGCPVGTWFRPRQFS